MFESARKTFAANLAALSCSQPELASRLAEVAVAATVEPCLGRDNHPTLRIREENGRRTWFGGSSMPSISARAAVAHLPGAGESIHIPGIATGLEPLLAAASLPRYSAVFVHEPDLVRLRLAMHLHDYSEVFARGRIVLLTGPDLASALADFIRSNPGYEPPATLLPLPQRTPAEIADAERRLIRAGREARDIQDDFCTGLSRRLHGGEVMEPTSRIGIISLDPRSESIELARAMATSLQRDQKVCGICVPDRPGHAHTAARLNLLVEVRANAVICVNSYPGKLASYLSCGLPVVGWWAFDAPPAPPGGQVPPGLMLCAGSRTIASRLAAWFEDGRHVAQLSPGLPDEWIASAESGEVAALDVVLLADLPDDRPESCGVTLPSQVQLWKAGQRAADERGDRPVLEPGKLLSAAEERSGVRIKDEGLRRRVAELFGGRVAPAARLRRLARRLVEPGRRVALLGAGWQREPEWEAYLPHCPAVGELVENVSPISLVRAARCLVVPELVPLRVPLALAAVASGRKVVTSAAYGDLATEYPDLIDLAPAFGTADSIETITRQAAGGTLSERPPASEWSRAVVESHTVTARTRRLVEMVESVRHTATQGA